MGSLIPKRPKEQESARMPDPDDKSAEESRRRALSAASSRGGREATVLSGDPYGSNKLGSNG